MYEYKRHLKVIKDRFIISVISLKKVHHFSFITVIYYTN